MFQAGATEIAWTPFRLSETNASFKAMTKVDQIVVTLHALLNLFSWPLIHSIPKLIPLPEISKRKKMMYRLLGALIPHHNQKHINLENLKKQGPVMTNWQQCLLNCKLKNNLLTWLTQVTSKKSIRKSRLWRWWVRTTICFVSMNFCSVFAKRRATNDEDNDKHKQYNSVQICVYLPLSVDSVQQASLTRSAIVAQNGRPIIP